MHTPPFLARPVVCDVGWRGVAWYGMAWHGMVWRGKTVIVPVPAFSFRCGPGNDCQGMQGMVSRLDDGACVCLLYSTSGVVGPTLRASWVCMHRYLDSGSLCFLVTLWVCVMRVFSSSFSLRWFVLLFSRCALCLGSYLAWVLGVSGCVGFGELDTAFSLVCSGYVQMKLDMDCSIGLSVCLSVCLPVCRGDYLPTYLPFSTMYPSHLYYTDPEEASRRWIDLVGLVLDWARWVPSFGNCASILLPWFCVAFARGRVHG